MRKNKLRKNFKYCSKILPVRNIISHEKRCPENHSNDSQTYTCSLCDKSFTRKYHLMKHISICSSGNKPAWKCLYDECLGEFHFQFKLGLIKHLRHNHGWDIKCPEILPFESVSEFENWKEEEETKTFSYFTQRSGSKNGQTYFYCQHSGSSKPHRRKDEEARKTCRKIKVGRIKKDIKCPALIRLSLNNDAKCYVRYFPIHCHPLRIEDLKHHPQRKETYEFIDQQIALNLPPSEIVGNLRDISSEFYGEEDISKANLVTKNLVRLRAKKLRSSLKFEDGDEDSVYHLIQAINEDSTGQVVYDPPLAQECDIIPAEVPESENSFVLDTQTDEQLRLMCGEECKILVVGDTHISLDDTQSHNSEPMLVSPSHTPGDLNLSSEDLTATEKSQLINTLDNDFNTVMNFVMSGNLPQHVLTMVSSTVDRLARHCEAFSNSPKWCGKTVTPKTDFSLQEKPNVQSSQIKSHLKASKRKNKQKLFDGLSNNMSLKEELPTTYKNSRSGRLKYKEGNNALLFLGHDYCE